MSESENLSHSSSESSDRKRKIVMLNRSSFQGCASSASDSHIDIPATKIGKHEHMRTLSDENKPSTAACHFEIQSKRSSSSKVTIGDGSKRCNKRHEYTAIIKQGLDDPDRGLICRFSCGLGDVWRYSYQPVPGGKKALPMTGQNCTNQAVRELALKGLSNIENIHQGQYSQIFSAYDDCGMRYVAIKLLNKEQHLCKRPLRSTKPCSDVSGNPLEVGFLRQLQHPNVIQLISCIDTKIEKLAIVLEFCASGSLASLLSNTGIMTEQVALRYFKQMFAAIKYLHNKDLAICNICLRHFLLTNKNEVKLVDMGQLTALHVPCVELSGIIGYQAPESVRSSKDIPYQAGPTDIWALGVCLFTMVTGITTTAMQSVAPSYRLAFVFPDPKVLMLSESIHELLSGMLEFLPNHRFTINRVQFSDWMAKSDVRVSIGGFHFLAQPQKVKTSWMDWRMRNDMEL